MISVAFLWGAFATYLGWSMWVNVENVSLRDRTVYFLIIAMIIPCFILYIVSLFA